MYFVYYICLGFGLVRLAIATESGDRRRVACGSDIPSIPGVEYPEMRLLAPASSAVSAAGDLINLLCQPRMPAPGGFPLSGSPAKDTVLSAHRGPVNKRPPDRTDVTGTKGSVFYRAHSYHTKVPVEGIQRLVEHYTNPGDVVVDPFCGSGQTGVAAILAGRHAVLSDLSPAAVHIARGYTSRTDPKTFSAAAEHVMDRLSDLEADLYGTADGRLEYMVWTDIYECADCAAEINFWDAAVDRESGVVSQQINCPEGHGPFRKASLRWLRSRPVEENIRVEGESKRLVRAADPNHSMAISRADIPYWYPTANWDTWREMWRAQHGAMAIRSAADFYTNRNLFALAALWHEIGRIDETPSRNALKFAFTSIVNRASRRYQWHPARPTNVLSSTMYVASLRYEFNVFSLFRRKLSTIAKMYQKTWRAPGFCEVVQGSATDLSWIPDESVDYVFADPPFGSNIFYGDSSFLWEAWLGAHTDLGAEAVVNRRLQPEMGGKSLVGYEDLMARSLAEIKRILRPEAWASLQFHNSDDLVWSSLQRAVESAGLTVGSAVMMDKGQTSFKGLRHEGKGERVANFDLVMHLDQRASLRRQPATRGAVADAMQSFLGTAPASKRTTPWLHSAVMRFLLSEGASTDGWSFGAIEALCEDLFDREGSQWRKRHH